MFVGAASQRVAGGPLTRIYVDSANLDEIERAAALGVIRGVTTNPSLLAAHGAGDLPAHIAAICDLVEETVSVQVVGDDADAFVEQGCEIASWHPRTIVKLPVNRAGTAAARRLAARGISTNLTMVCSAAQGLLAIGSGARIVCCYVGRVADRGEDPLRTVSDIATWIARGGYQVDVMAASVRSPEQAVNVARAGATILTLPFRVIEAMYHHPVTTEAVQRFEADWRGRSGGVDARSGRLTLA